MKNKIIFILGRSASIFGTQIYNFVFALLILYKTGSALNFAITLIIETIPRIIFSTYGGIIADKKERKKIIIYCDFLCAFLLLVAYLFLLKYNENLIIIFILTFILNSINTVFDISMNSSLNDLFKEENLQQMCSANEGITSLVSFIAPTLGATIYALTNFKTFVLINSISFFVSAIMETKLDFPKRVKQLCKEKKVKDELHETIEYIFKEKIVLVLYSAAIFINIFFGIGVSLAFPVIVSAGLHMSEIQYGILETALSLGMLVGATILSMHKQKKSYRVIVTALMVEAISIFCLGIPYLVDLKISWFYVYLFILFILGISVSAVNISVRVLMQRTITNDIKGKIFGTLSTFCLSISPIIMILGALYIDTNNPYTLVFISGFSFIIMNVILINNKYLKNV